jgi:hypothetical protein
MRLEDPPAVARAIDRDVWPLAVALAVVGPLAFALVVAAVALVLA